MEMEMDVDPPEFESTTAAATTTFPSQCRPPSPGPPGWESTKASTTQQQQAPPPPPPGWGPTNSETGKESESPPPPPGCGRETTTYSSPPPPGWGPAKESPPPPPPPGWETTTIASSPPPPGWGPTSTTSQTAKESPLPPEPNSKSPPRTTHQVDPSISPTPELGQLICGVCRSLLSYPSGAIHVKCAGCRTVNHVLQAHQVGLVKCGSCFVLLMYKFGSPSVKCSCCRFVTEIGVDNKRPLFPVAQDHSSSPHTVQ